MAAERPLSIIKPDATRRNLTGAINERFERAGLRIVAQKRLRLTRDMAERFPYRPSLIVDSIADLLDG
jgi:nucleoside-diphosphate kinase